MRFRLLPPILVGLCLFAACGEPGPESAFPVLTGDYFGQTPPGAEPELFAPGLVCSGLLDRDVTMTPDGDELYFCMTAAGYKYATILFTKRVDGVWTEPAVAPFADNPAWMNIEPAISPDGARFFFLSNRPDGDEQAGDSDIWVMDREGDAWGEPYNLGAPINSDAQEFYPSPTADGTLYFTRSEPGTRIHYILRSRLVDGVYQEPERLPSQVNCGRNRFNAFVAPDESYVIVPTAGLADTRGGVDYYITFRSEDDAWTEPLNMGDRVNSSDGSEWSASVSPAGRVLFFMSARQPDLEPDAPLDYGRLLDMQSRPQNGNADIYWMSADVIGELRTAAYAAGQEDRHE